MSGIAYGYVWSLYVESLVFADRMFLWNGFSLPVFVRRLKKSKIQNFAITNAKNQVYVRSQTGTKSKHIGMPQHHRTPRTRFHLTHFTHPLCYINVQ